MMSVYKPYTVTIREQVIVVVQNYVAFVLGKKLVCPDESIAWYVAGHVVAGNQIIEHRLIDNLTEDNARHYFKTLQNALEVPTR